MHGLWACLLQSRDKVTSWLTCHVMSLQVSISKDNGFLVIRIGFHKAAATAFFSAIRFPFQMGQGAAAEQPAAHARHLPPRLRLLAHVALARQRGVERSGLQIDYLRCGKVS